MAAGQFRNVPVYQFFYIALEIAFQLSETLC